jgi:SAM-dependent methyltransferase
MRILVGMPRYSNTVNMEAAQAFYNCVSKESKLDVRLLTSSSSLLTANFNQMWATVRNEWEAGALDAFAMIHSDVGPPPGWLDVLHRELLASGADLLATVIPLKDARGLSSTGVDDLGDEYKVRRLAMKEILDLPVTFTEKDVPNLLLNTGLWLCKLGPWILEAHFRQQDCIRRENGQWMSRAMSEDWDFSRQCRTLGVKLAATRAVKVRHHGDHVWGNQGCWGWERDRENVPAEKELPPLPSPGWVYPADVAGWLTEAEGRLLGTLAKGREVLEIGSFCGLSTICMAQTAKWVVAVDPFDGRGTQYRGATLEAFVNNIRRHRVWHNIHTLTGPSEEILPGQEAESFDLVFIDGSHDKASVTRDAELARRVLRPGGLLAFHDYHSGIDPGVDAAVDELIAAGATLIERVGSIAVLSPCVEPALAGV